jgi:hypothetical protein
VQSFSPRRFGWRLTPADPHRDPLRGSVAAAGASTRPGDW